MNERQERIAAKLMFGVFACYFGALLSLGWSLIVHDARHVFNPGVIIFGGGMILCALGLLVVYGAEIFGKDDRR